MKQDPPPWVAPESSLRGWVWPPAQVVLEVAVNDTSLLLQGKAASVMGPLVRPAPKE